MAVGIELSTEHCEPAQAGVLHRVCLKGASRDQASVLGEQLRVVQRALPFLNRGLPWLRLGLLGLLLVTGVGVLLQGRC